MSEKKRKVVFVNLRNSERAELVASGGKLWIEEDGARETIRVLHEMFCPSASPATPPMVQRFDAGRAGPPSLVTRIEIDHDVRGTSVRLYLRALAPPPRPMPEEPLG